MAELEALREATAALLEARGAPAEAAIVRSGTLSLLPGSRRWSVGSREVDAMSFELALDAPELVSLRAQDAGGQGPGGHRPAGQVPGAPDPLRDALADAVASASTMLSELHVVLRLPGLEAPWGSVYRTAPTRPQPAAVDERQVLAGAVALLRAEGLEGPATLLGRGRLESAPVPASDSTPLRRWVVLLAPADAAQALREPTQAHLQWAIAAAATRAAEAVAGVEIAVG